MTSDRALAKATVERAIEELRACQHPCLVQVFPHLWCRHCGAVLTAEGKWILPDWAVVVSRVLIS